MIILPFDPQIADWVAAGRGTTHACQTPSLKEMVTDVVCISERVFWTPGGVSRRTRMGGLHGMATLP